MALYLRCFEVLDATRMASGNVADKCREALAQFTGTGLSSCLGF